MRYSADIFDKTPERIMTTLAAACRKRRLERGLSRPSLSRMTGVPTATIAHFETTGKISLASLARIAIEFDYFDDFMALLSEPRFTTGAELDTINHNQHRQKGR